MWRATAILLPPRARVTAVTSPHHDLQTFHIGACAANRGKVVYISTSSADEADFRLRHDNRFTVSEVVQGPTYSHQASMKPRKIACLSWMKPNAPPGRMYCIGHEIESVSA